MPVQGAYVHPSTGCEPKMRSSKPDKMEPFKNVISLMSFDVQLVHKLKISLHYHDWLLWLYRQIARRLKTHVGQKQSPEVHKRYKSLCIATDVIKSSLCTFYYITEQSYSSIKAGFYITGTSGQFWATCNF